MFIHYIYLISDIFCLKMSASGLKESSAGPPMDSTEQVNFVLPELDQDGSDTPLLDEMPVALEIVTEHYKTLWFVVCNFVETIYNYLFSVLMKK